MYGVFGASLERVPPKPGYSPTQARIKAIMTTCDPYKTMIADMGPERAETMMAHTCYTVHYTRGAIHDGDIFNMLAALCANGAFASFFPQPSAPQLALPQQPMARGAAPAPASTCDEDTTPRSPLPPAPKYEARHINRGKGVDTFFNKPLASYSFM